MQELIQNVMLKSIPLEGRLPPTASQAVTEEAGFWTEMFERFEEADHLPSLGDAAPIMGRADALVPIHLSTVIPLVMMVPAAQQDVASVELGDTILSAQVVHGGRDDPAIHLLPGSNAPSFDPSAASDQMLTLASRNQDALWPDASVPAGRGAAQSPSIWTRFVATDQSGSEQKTQHDRGFDPQTQIARGPLPVLDQALFDQQAQTPPFGTAAVAQPQPDVPRASEPPFSAPAPSPAVPLVHMSPPVHAKDGKTSRVGGDSVPILVDRPPPIVGTLVGPDARVAPPVVDVVAVPQDAGASAPITPHGAFAIGPVGGTAQMGRVDAPNAQPPVDALPDQRGPDQRGPDQKLPDDIRPEQTKIQRSGFEQSGTLRHDPAVQVFTEPRSDTAFDPLHIASAALSYSKDVQMMGRGGVDAVQAPHFDDGGLVITAPASASSSPPVSAPTIQGTPPSAALFHMTVAQQIGVQIDRQLGALPPHTQGANVTEFTLNPPELGRVRMTLETSRTGALALTIVAERPEVADFMRRHSPALIQEFLREGLTQTSVKIEAGQTLALHQGQSGGQTSGQALFSQSQPQNTSMAQMQTAWGEGQSQGQNPKQQRDQEWSGLPNGDGGARPTEPSGADQIQVRPAIVSSRALDLRL